MEWIGIIIGLLIATIFIGAILLTIANAQRDNAIYREDRLKLKIAMLKMELLMERE